MNLSLFATRPLFSAIALAGAALISTAPIQAASTTKISLPINATTTLAKVAKKGPILSLAPEMRSGSSIASGPTASSNFAARLNDTTAQRATSPMMVLDTQTAIDNAPQSAPAVTIVRPVVVAPEIVKPETGLSAEDRAMLAQADADARRAQRRLASARGDLDEGVRDLAGFNNALQKAMLDAGPDSSGLHPFVRTAQRYAGTPYVWGGESARGFDCSGFIIRVMRDLGYRSLPHSAAEQFNYGTPIARALLKPGDLVFFANTYKPGISHVGIFLGRGRFIHAAGTGKGTIVSYLSASPYNEKYAGARRLMNKG